MCVFQAESGCKENGTPFVSAPVPAGVLRWDQLGRARPSRSRAKGLPHRRWAAEF